MRVHQGLSFINFMPLDSSVENASHFGRLGLHSNIYSSSLRCRGQNGNLVYIFLRAVTGHLLVRYLRVISDYDRYEIWRTCLLEYEYLRISHEDTFKMGEKPGSCDLFTYSLH